MVEHEMNSPRDQRSADHPDYWSDFIASNTSSKNKLFSSGVESELRIISFPEVRETDKTLLASLGIDVSIVASLLEEVFPEVQQAYQILHDDDLSWIPCNEAVRCADTLKLSRVSRPQVYQAAALRYGELCIRSPISGNAIASRHSFLFYHAGLTNVFYRFDDKIVFFLINPNHTFRALYFPVLNLFLWFRPYDNHGWRDPTQVLAAFRSHIELRRDLSVSYLSNEKPPATTMLITHNLLGHFVMNVINHAKTLLDLGLDSYIDHYLVGPQEFLPFDVIFPEAAGEKLLRHNFSNSLGELALERNLFTVLSWNNVFSERLGERIRQAASEQIPATASAICRFRESACPILWFHLRSRRRIWLEQETAIPAITERLRQEFPRLAVVLDGMSRLEEGLALEPGLLDADTTLRASETALAGRIMAAIPPGTPVVSLIGATPWEKILWATSATIFVEPAGSGMVWTGSIANRPGIYLGNTAAMGFQRPYSDRAENVATRYFLAPPDVQSSNDSDPAADFSVNWEVVYKTIQKLIKQLSITCD